MCVRFTLITIGQLATNTALSCGSNDRERISAIVGVQFDNGSPLALGVVGSDFQPLQTSKFWLYSVNL